MGNMKLHRMEEWESVFHTKQIEHVYYTSDMLVRKVTGYIIISRKSLSNGIIKKCRATKAGAMGRLRPVLQHQQQHPSA